MREFDPQIIYQTTVRAGEEWAVANSEANFLEETRKTLRASLMLKHIEKGDSAAAAETKATASDEYKLHIKGMVEARQKADTLKVNYFALQELSNNRRTEAVNLRREKDFV